MKNKIKGFTKEDTLLIKGVAIVLMLMHHIWAFPDRIPINLESFIGNNRLYAIGLFGKICVPIYFFVGGYGLYLCSKKKKFSILDRIKRLYVSYWKIFLIMIPLGFIFFQNQPAYVDSIKIYNRVKFSGIEEFLSNFFAIVNTYNGEWWFLKSYVLCLILFPMYKNIIESKQFNIFYGFFSLSSCIFVFPVYFRL